MCLKQETGSCAGCNVLSFISNRVQSGQNIELAADVISGQYCPDGVSPQTQLVERVVGQSYNQEPTRQTFGEGAGR
jgi:hypothetical protein